MCICVPAITDFPVRKYLKSYLKAYLRDTVGFALDHHNKVDIIKRVVSFLTSQYICLKVILRLYCSLLRVQ